MYKSVLGKINKLQKKKKSMLHVEKNKVCVTSSCFLRVNVWCKTRDVLFIFLHKHAYS